MKNVIGLIKVNKKVIIRTTLVVGGVLGGIAIFATKLRPKHEDENEVSDTAYDESEENEVNEIE